MNLNRAMIIGNLTRDPEVRTTPNGQNVASFSVATNRRWTDQATGQPKEEVEYHNIVAWGRLAEIAGQYLSRGRKVYVEGRLKTREWDGQDGVRRNRTEIIAENFILLDRPPAGTPANYQQPANNTVTTSQPQATAPSAPAAPPPPSAPDNEIKLEDIPF